MINPFESQHAVDIEVKNLSFSYQKGKNILTNINMHIEKGFKGSYRRCQWFWKDNVSKYTGRFLSIG